MSEREELLAANAAIQKVLDEGAEARLRDIPGVEHVSVGLKVTGDRVTDELCIHVYVTDKRPEAELSAAQCVPSRINGVPTDVRSSPRAEFTIDTTRYRPLTGGCLIGNERVALHHSGSGTQKAAGTFGCTATRDSDGSTVLLSNWHILTKNGAGTNDPIYQPPTLTIPTVDPATLPRRMGNEEDAIAFIVDAKVTSKVDAGIARLDVSSCCRCCGLDFRDQIIGLSVAGTPPSNGIIGKRAAVAGSTVYKVGAVTGRTVGRVVTASAGPVTARREGTDYPFTGQIEISSQDTTQRFSAVGDSGSVVIDGDGYIVGLQFASVGAPPAARSYANHIDDVCTELGITINFVEGHGTAGQRVERPLATLPLTLSTGAQKLYAGLRARLQDDPAGRWLWELAEVHREEIVTLITTQRRVAVVWHRVGGPALFAQALEKLKAGDDETLPSPPGGNTMDDALTRMGDALRAHGSESLKSAIAAHGAAVVSAAGGSKTLSGFLDRLRPHALAHACKGQTASAAVPSIERG